VFALKRFQPGNQPHGRKRRPGGDGHALAPRALANLPHRRINAFQRHACGAQQLRAGAGELHRPRVAQEKRRAHLVFQRLNLPAHRALRERKLFASGPKVQVPGHGFKGAQVAGSNGPGARVAGGELHGRA
jgi:hypothetical protein